MIVRPIVCRSFIGRRDELAFLHERRLLAAKSRGAIVLVEGEPGIGKSRLLAEFSAPLTKSPPRVARATCLEHAKRPYGPLLDLLGDLEGRAVELSPEAARREQFDAILRRFELAAERASIVAIIEDVHWADIATLELLAFLAPKLDKLRILLVASHRPHDETFAEATQGGLARLIRAARHGNVVLGPLDDASLRLFIDETMLGYSLPDEMRHAVVRTCEGNPFFAEELLKSVVEHATNASARGAAFAVPSTLRSTLLERWHHLTEADRRVLGQAAVIGRTFDVALLARTLGLDVDRCLGSLARARDLQLVEGLSAGIFRYRHALTREAIYAGFLEAQLQPLHRTIAATLERMPEAERPLESLAYHWWAAGDGLRAARYNELAGDAAATLHAHEDAITFYGRALQAPTLSDADRGSLSEKIADRCYALGLTERTHASYGIAAAHFQNARDDEQEARCRIREALAAYTLGLAAPTEALEAMLGRLDPSAHLTRSRVHLGIAWLQASFWYPTEAARQLAMVDPRDLAVPDLSLRYHNVAAWVAMTDGDLKTFLREFSAWVDAAKNAGTNALALAHVNGSWCLTVFGLHEDAAEHVERALAIARAERNRLLEDATLGHAAVAYLMSGDLLRARAVLDRVPPTSGSYTTMAHATSSGVLVGIHLGDDELIATWFDGADAAAIAAPDASCGEGFAEVLTRRGRTNEAKAVLARALPACERVRGIAGTLLATARYGATEDLARARALLVSAADSPAQMLEGPALELFDAYVALREGRRAEAAGKARSAAAGFRHLRFPLFEAAAHEAAGDFAAALAVYVTCGALGDIRRLQGSGVVLREDGAAGPLVLSGRELEITNLVARGKSNYEIARSLAISHKTVEKHLSSAYQKLGFSSRVQLAAHIAANGHARTAGEQGALG